MDRFPNPTGGHYACLSATFGEGPLRITQETFMRYLTQLWQSDRNGLNHSEDFGRKKTCCQQVGPCFSQILQYHSLDYNNKHCSSILKVERIFLHDNPGWELVHFLPVCRWSFEKTDHIFKVQMSPLAHFQRWLEARVSVQFCNLTYSKWTSCFSEGCYGQTVGLLNVNYMELNWIIKENMTF